MVDQKSNNPVELNRFSSLEAEKFLADYQTHVKHVEHVLDKAN